MRSHIDTIVRTASAWIADERTGLIGPPSVQPRWMPDARKHPTRWSLAATIADESTAVDKRWETLRRTFPDHAWGHLRGAEALTLRWARGWRGGRRRVAS